MIESEKLRTKEMIAECVGIEANCIEMRDMDLLDGFIFYMLKYKNFNLCLSFRQVPTRYKIVEQIKDMYLSGVEIDFDEEMAAK